MRNDAQRWEVRMRSDMAKVIVERPRKKGHAWNKPKGYLRALRRYGEDGPPAREGIKACWAGQTKYLNEHLGPLRRYLDKQVGRPWDKVFSEICTHIDRNNAVQDHVRDHVEDYVTVNVVLIDGVPCSGEGGRAHGRPLARLYWGRRWYVCPRTGLLRRIEGQSRKSRGRVVVPAAPRYVRLDASSQCRNIEGSWYVVDLKPLPEPHRLRDKSHEIDVLLNRRVSAISMEEARAAYGAAVYAVGARRLSRRELPHFPVPRDWWD
jgi:hypothetical protein